MITLEDIKRVEISDPELVLIKEYVDKNFPKLEIDKRSSQWHYEGETRNPNQTGIIGEWGLIKYYTGITLPDFLAKRIRFKSDRGDGVANGMTFDIKVINWRVKPAWLWNQDRFRGLVEEKHLRKNFIDAFIFSTFNPEENALYLYGYKTMQDLKTSGDYHLKGDQLSEKFTVPCNGINIRFKDLDSLNYMFFDSFDPVLSDTVRVA